jgi:signal transduction histidine kinase/ActR/RegA family two-component response regulator
LTDRPDIGARAITIAQASNFLVFVVGAVVLAGWLFDFPKLTNVFIPGASMKSNAGLALACGALANQLLITARNRKFQRLVGLGVALLLTTIGALTLSEHVVGWDLGIDQVLATEAAGAYATTSPNRMGPPASTAFCLLGIALLLGERPRRTLRRASQALVLVVCIIALLPIIGYAYGVSPLYDVAQYTGIALMTAVALLLLSVAILAGRPERGAVAMLRRSDEAGVLLRGMLPPVLLLPFGAGWVLARAVRSGIIDGPFAISSMVLFLIVGLTFLIARTGSQLARTLDARMSAERALSASERSLREADRQKNEFLATLSHELRNPLAPIRFALELLNGPPEIAARSRQSIARQVKHLTRLIDDLLDLTRITRNKLQLKTRDVELRAVVQDAIDSSSAALISAGHQLEVHLPDEPIWLHADADRLVQVLTNLLGNAARYTNAGGRIVLSAERHTSDVLISVRDNGVGLAPADLSRVFDMFVQVGQGSHGGLGIGLALVKGLIELHGGTVEARSEGVNLGAEFRIRLPRTTAPATKGTKMTASLPVEPRRILVVDDNRDAADQLGEWLIARGHQIEVRYDADEALRCGEIFQPDVGLLDIGLPGMSGYELAARLREMSRNGGLLLIAITGWGQQEDRQRALEAGFDAHLTKPADPALIEELIAASVDPDARG